jgi:hypothetical protein
MLSVPSDDPFGPTKITKNHFLQAMQACRFPPRFVQTLSSNNGHVAHFTEYEGGNVEYLCKLKEVLLLHRAKFIKR